MSRPRNETDRMIDYACIIEQLVDPVQGPSFVPPWQAWRDMNGIAELRAVALDLVEPCNADWERAYKLYEAGKVEDPGSFDYEFVPFWLSQKVDWSDLRGKPRVRGTTVPEPVTLPVRLPDTTLRCPGCRDSTHLYDRADVRYDPLTGDWVVGDREGTIECTECDWSGAESDLVTGGGNG